MATESKKTTWEKVQAAVLRSWPDGVMPSDPEQLNDVGLSLYVLAKEIDELRRRNAGLDAQLREMATEKR